MKNWIIILMACAAMLLPVQGASSRIVATITITNAPTDGDGLLVNGDLRTWKNTVTAPANEILIGADAGLSATNLYRHAAAARFAGPLIVTFSSTNVITMVAQVDQALSVSLSAAYGSVQMTTNPVVSAIGVYVPFDAGPSASLAANVASQIASGLSGFSTNALSEGTKLVENLVQIGAVQTITGAKTFAGGTILSNTLAIHFVGSPLALPTNGIIFTTNGVAGTNTFFAIIGDAFGYPTIVDSGGNPPSTMPDNLGGIITYNLLNKYFPKLGDTPNTNFWTSQNVFDTTSANTATISNIVALAGTISGTTLTQNTYSGDIGSLTNGTIKGTTLTNVTIHGTIGTLNAGLLNGVGSTNLTTTNTASWGKLDVAESIGFRALTISSLANGVNAAVPIGNATLVILSGGPTGPFSLDGIAGGFNGRFLIVVNKTGQDMTINNESGSEATAANRITTQNGSTRSTTGNGVVTLAYNSNTSRWELASLEP